MPEGFKRASRVITGNSSLLGDWIPARQARLRRNTADKA